MSRRWVERKEKAYQKILMIFSLVSVVSIFLIAFFIMIKGYPAIEFTGIGKFIFGTEWKGTQNIFGLWPMIVGTTYITLTALVVGIPIGIATAVFLAEIAPKRVADIFRPAIQLLAGIPSVVYGLFGMVVGVPAVRALVVLIYQDRITAKVQSGYGVLTAGLILAIMILPTIINISEDALNSVPREYKEGSLALGASHFRTIIRVIIPAAKSGIIASITLGLGRALGETMAVIMVAGNSPIVPTSIFDKTRTLTSNIAIEMSYAADLHSNALFATGIVLFIIIMLVNFFAAKLMKGGQIND